MVWSPKLIAVRCVEGGPGSDLDQSWSPIVGPSGAGVCRSRTALQASAVSAEGKQLGTVGNPLCRTKPQILCSTLRLFGHFATIIAWLQHLRCHLLTLPHWFFADPTLVFWNQESFMRFQAMFRSTHLMAVVADLKTQNVVAAHVTLDVTRQEQTTRLWNSEVLDQTTDVQTPSHFQSPLSFPDNEAFNEAFNDSMGELEILTNTCCW